MKRGVLEKQPLLVALRATMRCAQEIAHPSAIRLDKIIAYWDSPACRDTWKRKRGECERGLAWKVVCVERRQIPHGGEYAMEHWKIQQSQYLINDKWITVRADSCVTEDGVCIEPYYVLEYTDWAHIVALNPHNEVLITRQYRHGAQCLCTEIPCGVIEAAHRELQEETGCTVTDMKQVGQFYANPSNQTNRVHCFLAYGTAVTGDTNFDESENILFEFVPVNDVLDMMAQGKISQGLHIASLYLGLRAAGYSSVHMSHAM